MSRPYRYSYNPFALGGLIRFLRTYRIILSIMGVVLILLLILIKKQLPPLPPDKLRYDPSLSQLSPLDLSHQTFTPLDLYHIPTSTIDGIFTAIDVQGRFCPIITHTGIDQARVDILNLETQETFYLASYHKDTVIFPFYRPRHDEILIVKNGVEDTIMERLRNFNELCELLINPKIRASVYRFNAFDGSFLGRLDLTEPIWPIDVSPDGSKLLARAEKYASTKVDRLMIIDLDSGLISLLPFEEYNCLFESDEALFLYEYPSAVRYHLKEQRIERLSHISMEEHFPFATQNFQMARKIGKYYFKPFSAQSNNIFASISLDGAAIVESWEYPKNATLGFPDLFYSDSMTFHPARKLIRGVTEIKGVRAFSYHVSEALHEFTTGKLIKVFPDEVERLSFLNDEMLWLYAGGKSHFVRIDDFLDESFQLNLDGRDK